MTRATRSPIAITGFGWEIPHYACSERLTEAFQQGPVASPVFAPEQKLGKKGLRYKERATLMALCAARDALQHAGFIDAERTSVDADDFGVVMASNTGNLDTVCHAAEVIRSDHVNATSSMDLPNASSNVVASTLAIRFGLRALNLMICSGASASLDALILAANTIRNGRARRVLVGSVETDGLALRSLLAQTRVSTREGESPILEGASAVILESLGSATARGATVYGFVADHAYGHLDGADGKPLGDLLARHPGKARYVSTPSFPGISPDDGQHIHLGEPVTRAYGSAALLQLIHACEAQQHHSPAEAKGAVVISGGGWRDRRTGALVLEAGGRA